MNVREQVVQRFGQLHESEPQLLVRAPGRVNLIGEHTDYNDGYVLPMAIDREIWIALRARQDGRVRVASLDYGETREFGLDALVRAGQGWIEYLKGVAWALQGAGFRLRGWEGVLAGDVPREAGLSSSAAVELVTARAFAALSALPWDPMRVARLGQKVENEWIGVNSGIMDQAVVAGGVADHALLIDCRSLEATPVPLPSGVVVVVLDTATRRGLVDSAYNERRAQCEAAARYFGVCALRDLDEGTLLRGGSGLDERTRRRAHHVVTENARTLAAVAAMRTGDVVRLGRLMDASHESLRADFEVSSRELDLMVELAREHPGCLGARMTGAGFGGCAVALVREAAADEFLERVPADYAAATGLEPQAYACRAAAGAGVEEPVAARA